MIDFKTIAASALIATVAAAGASAQNFAKFGSVNGWDVFTNSDDKTCVIETRKADGMIVQMGLTKEKKLGYLGVFTSDPTGVKKGEKREFVIDIDGDVFTATSTGMKGNITEGYSGAYILADNPNFIADVANKQTLKAIDTENVFTLDLTGTKAAMEMGRECIGQAMSN